MEKRVKYSSKPSKKATIFMLVVIFVSISAGFVGGWLGAKSLQTNVNPSVSEGRQVVREQSTLISSIAEEVGPSVVSIDVTSESVTQDLFFGPQTQQQQSAGTGFIISEDGYVMTNRHVVPDGVSQVSLTMSDGTILDDVAVIGTTSDNDSLDVGFLKINDTKGKNLQPVKIGDSSAMVVGDTVVAIGNALGQFQNTVTSGIISGYGRSVVASDQSGANTDNLQNLFQTDAAINQGNSGGPLVNSDGEVIGINTAVAGGTAQNIGFAIPINDAKGLIDGVIENGTVERPYLGVQYIQLSQGNAEELGVSQTEGAYVNRGDGSNGVVSGSPAAQAGLENGDIIIKVNDQDVNSQNTLASVIGRFQVGDKVTITYIRDGNQQTTEATLAALPN
ncbi:trypsin-like peptidase domain-containing protein [Candidatus Saccharibacteria bacterium]|nr:trypsin-like peptidase domain-containing protein [Candidatus Saccharibacteria bacterium]